MNASTRATHSATTNTLFAAIVARNPQLAPNKRDRMTDDDAPDEAEPCEHVATTSVELVGTIVSPRAVVVRVPRAYPIRPAYRG